MDRQTDPCCSQYSSPRCHTDGRVTMSDQNLRVSYAADDAHRPPLRGSATDVHFAVAVRAASRTDGRTDRHRAVLIRFPHVQSTQ